MVMGTICYERTISMHISDEWVDFASTPVRVILDGGTLQMLFDAEDVAGDGSCYFHTAIASGVVRDVDAAGLRARVVSFMRGAGHERHGTTLAFFLVVDKR